MLNDRAAQILDRFPGPVAVTPVLTWSDGLFTAGSVLIAIVCLWGSWLVWHLNQAGSSIWGLGLCAAFFAFLAGTSAVRLRTSSMTLDREGFDVVVGFRQTKRFLWREVSAFKKQYFGRRNYGVAFDHARKADGIFSGLNRALGFRNSTLLEDFGMGEDQLAELLNLWRERALAKAPGDFSPTGPRIAGG